MLPLQATADARSFLPGRLHSNRTSRARRLTALRVESKAMAPPATATEPITQADLVAYLASGCKPRSKWRIGTEHEKLGYYKSSKRRLEYSEIQALLEGLCKRYGWDAIMEGPYIIGAELDGQSVTIEPGGQFELSGAPVDSLHKTCTEVKSHLDQVKSIAADLGVAFLDLGFDPKWSVAEVPIMPKNRYKIMRDYMPHVGSLGHDMMFRSTTIQVNIDFEDEKDMVEKMRIGIALQPVATALFANSPFRDGKDTGYLSWRSHVWEDVDSDRCGILPFVWDDDFGFERYTEYALDVLMYFVNRNKEYLSATGKRATFRDFMAGNLPILPGELPTIKDWETHLTTIFPEVRLKRYMEMRGADGGPWNKICALSALWIGLLYSRDVQTATYKMIQDWTLEEHRLLRREVPKSGLQTTFRHGKLQDVAKKVLQLSRQGLEERGLDEASFLDPLDAIVASGKSSAALLKEKFHSEWAESVDPIYSPDYTY